MSKGKVIVISPNPSSLYTTSICELLRMNEVEIQAVFVKKFTIKRFKNEFSRDGKRLLRKIWKKLVLRGKAYDDIEQDNIIKYRDKNRIKLNNVKELRTLGTDVYFVNDINSSYVESKLKKYNTDLIVFTGGGMIRSKVLDNSGLGVINCHMGILPKYRGMDVIEWPILNNDFENIGLTLHFMDTGVDTGDILQIRKVPLKKNDSIKNIRVRFEPKMVQGMLDVVLDLLDNNITVKKQKNEDGHQFFVMSDDLIDIAKKKIDIKTQSL